MTTTVIVQAHCASHLHVEVQIEDAGRNGPLKIENIENGKEKSFVVHDAKRITVREVPKL